LSLPIASFIKDVPSGIRRFKNLVGDGIAPRPRFLIDDQVSDLDGDFCHCHGRIVADAC
jgi:hypothetical protein